MQIYCHERGRCDPQAACVICVNKMINIFPEKSLGSFYVVELKSEEQITFIPIHIEITVEMFLSHSMGLAITLA